jgi:hypothetical protein
MALEDHRLCKIELSVEFERAGLNGKCPGCGSRSSRLVDNAYSHPTLCEPEREDQARRSSANDQQIGIHIHVSDHVCLPRVRQFTISWPWKASLRDSPLAPKPARWSWPRILLWDLRVIADC